MTEHIEYQPTLNKSKLTISPELVVDLSRYHGKELVRKVIHEVVDDWLNTYLEREE